MSSTKTNNSLITVSEAARQLGVNPATIYIWISRDQIPYVRYSTRTIRIPQSAIDKLMVVHNA